MYFACRCKFFIIVLMLEFGLSFFPFFLFLQLFLVSLVFRFYLFIFSNQGRVTRYNDSTGISRCDFSQKRAEHKGIQVRTKRDKCVSATKTKK